MVSDDKRKKMIGILICICFCFSVFGSGYPVFDISNWLTAIDQVYTSYDMVMNTIKQIEQAYEQYQYLIEQAKSWNFKDIQWDGDWDFRNEIGDITKSVNKQLNNVRRIEEMFTVKQYTLGGMAFTVRDLVGVGDRGKNISEIIKNAASVSKNSFDNAADALIYGMSDDQKMAIWRKYGLSPKNFIYMQQKKQLVNDLKDKIIGSATDEAIALQTELNTQGANAIVTEALDPNREHTEKEIQQQIILIIQELIKNLNNMGIKIDKASALTAWQQALVDEEKSQEEQAKLKQLRELDRPKVDTTFCL